MEWKQPSTEVISDLEKQLRGRIEALSQNVDRLQKNKMILRKYQYTQVSILAQKELAERSRKGSSTGNKANSGNADDDKLNGILSLAKEIRAISNKPAKLIHPDVQGNKPMKAGSRQSLQDALYVGSETQESSNPRFNDDMDRSLVPEENYLGDLHEQLLFLTRNRVPVSPSKLYMNSVKYCEEGKFLTKLLNRSEQPCSALFHTVSSSFPQLTSSDKHEARSTSPLSNSESLVAKLANQFKGLIVSYERFMKVRVSHETFKVSQLTVEDKKAMIAMWMRGRKLLELYRHYEKTSRRLQCTCESCVLSRVNHGPSSDSSSASAVDRSTPLSTPLPSPSAKAEVDWTAIVINTKSKAKSKQVGGSAANHSSAWGNSCKVRVEAFHSAYQSKLLLIAESAVGQEQLKGTIQALKTCCEDSTNRAKLGQIIAAGGGADTGFVSRWAESLKQFRLVYSLLLNEAQELNHCMFINKP